MEALKPKLLEELLACIVMGIPLPNPHVYTKPWIRDAAMMATVLDRIGEIDRIRLWIEKLEDPFDRNNGSEEPDNLGQALYLASLIGDDSHPVAKNALKRLPEFQGPDGVLIGTTDFSNHPRYAGRWLNFGLKSLGLRPLATIPDVGDSYESLFWMDGPKEKKPEFGIWESDASYPYLGWASAHAYRDPAPMHLLGRAEGWLTWESEASAADYSAIPSGHTSLHIPKTCAPHSWHAAEAWLYLDEPLDYFSALA